MSKVALGERPVSGIENLSCPYSQPYIGRSIISYLTLCQEEQAVICYRHGLPIPQTHKNSPRPLAQSEQERDQHIYRWQRFNGQHQGRQGQDNGQHSWHRNKLQNDFYQQAGRIFINSCWHICLDLGFDLRYSRGGVRGEIGESSHAHNKQPRRTDPRHTI